MRFSFQDDAEIRERIDETDDGDRVDESDLVDPMVDADDRVDDRDLTIGGRILQITPVFMFVWVLASKS